METYRDLTGAVARREPQMHKMIAQLVGLESPTEDRAAVNRCVTLVEGWIKASGGKSRRGRQKSAGDLLIGQFGPVRTKTKPVMLLGHLDTVWPLGTLRQMPFQVRGAPASWT
jgi:glutamate carboxypeptidase